MSRPSTSLLSSRVVNSLRTHLATDLTLLGRIHYKNQSQHRLALFWRRVVEVDRVGRRLLPALDGGLKEGASQKDVRRLALLTSRLFKAALNLHSHALPIFNLTHFLPLITTLIAIASRVWTLTGVLYGHLSAEWARAFPHKRPLLPLDGWEEAPSLAADLGLASGSSSHGSTPASNSGRNLQTLSAISSSVPSGLLVETGEVVQRKTPSSASAAPTPAPASTVLTSPLALDLGERLVRPSKLKPSPLDTPAVNSPRSTSPFQPPLVAARKPSPSPPAAAAAPAPSPSPLPPPPAIKSKKTLKRPIAAVIDGADDLAPEPVAKLKKPSSAKKASAPAASPFDSLLVPKKAVAKAAPSQVPASVLVEGVKRKKKRKADGDEIDDIFG